MIPGIEYANAGCVLENMAIAATSLGIDNIIWGGASFGYAVTEETAKEHTISVNRI